MHSEDQIFTSKDKYLRRSASIWGKGVCFHHGRELLHLFPNQLTRTTSTSARRANYGMHPFVRCALLMAEREQKALSGEETEQTYSLKKKKKKKVKVAVVPRQKPVNEWGV